MGQSSSGAGGPHGSEGPPAAASRVTDLKQSMHRPLAELDLQPVQVLTQKLERAGDLTPVLIGSGGERGRFLAHRVVVGAQSPVLLQELSQQRPQWLAQEEINAVVYRVDPRISKDVWRSALQFLR
ncbi:unnamed protein product [Prorocentrum cordatum]|uniref:Uncharacterized protein n=1 Tax=Prorocentrum cordatum TaxID=2364126 RepID=A0ABN9PIX2_9DINO|nr:unnamed protein product [Polarella glacialis]